MVCVIDKPTPNAFATGRGPKHAAVAVTTGLLSMLDRDELEGVLAHELAHIQHRDILIGTITATVVGAISIIAMIGRFAFLFGGMGGSSDNEGGGSVLGALLLMILAPIIATVLQLAISRSREYAADRGAAEMTGRPDALASALNKLAWGNAQMPERDPQPSTAHMKIVSPFSGKRRGSSSGLSSLFSTHPPIEERVRRLRAM
jgi:heat shock protein HtpX